MFKPGRETVQKPPKSAMNHNYDWHFFRAPLFSDDDDACFDGLVDADDDITGDVHGAGVDHGATDTKVPVEEAEAQTSGIAWKTTQTHTSGLVNHNDNTGQCIDKSRLLLVVTLSGWRANEVGRWDRCRNLHFEALVTLDKKCLVVPLVLCQHGVPHTCPSLLCVCMAIGCTSEMPTSQ